MMRTCFCFKRVLTREGGHRLKATQCIKTKVPPLKARANPCRA